MSPISVDMQNGGYGGRMHLPFLEGFNDGHVVDFHGNNCHYGGIFDAYKYCPPLASILNMAADAFINGNFYALNANTLNDVRGTNKVWQKLLDQPNSYQDGKQFLKSVHVYTQLYGWCYVYKRKLPGFDIPTLVAIPPYMIRIELFNEKPQRLELTPENTLRKIFCVFSGYEIEMRKEDLILFTDNTVMMDNITLLPYSRFWPHQSNINTIIASLNAQEGLIRHKGALGILSNGVTSGDAYDATAVTPKDKLRLQQDYERYGFTGSQQRVIITEYPLRWQQMSFNVTELGISEAIIMAIKGLCDADNFPFILTAFSDQSTYNNIDSADRRLYQNKIIPDSYSIMKTLAKGVAADLANVTFEANYDHIPALQVTMKEKGEGVYHMNRGQDIAWKSNLITLNEWREALNMNKIPEDKGGNLYYHEYNKQFGITPEVNQQGQNGTAEEDENESGSNQPNSN